MGFSTILLLILITILGIYFYSILALNVAVISLDLLFMDIDIEIGKIIIIATLTGIMIATTLELLFFATKGRKKDE